MNNIKYIKIPTICPCCGKELEIHENNGVRTLLCTNQSCEGKFINILDHFLGKRGLDVKGISKATLEKLIDWGWLSSREDIFKLYEHKKEWSNKEGFGIKSVEKILNAIEESKTTSVEKIISACGIPLIGATVAKDLAKRFKTWEEFREAIDNNFDFSSLAGYGYEMNKSLHSYDFSEMDNIVKNYLTTLNDVNEKNNDSLNNLIFVITGKVSHWKNRDELKSFIESYGGKVTSSVTSKTNYLINNDIESNSAKNIAAKKIGIEILTEENFLKKFDF